MKKVLFACLCFLSCAVYSQSLIVPGEAYNAAAWTNDYSVPTKHDLTTKLESMSVGGSPGNAPTNTLISLTTPATQYGLFYASNTPGTNASAAVNLKTDATLTNLYGGKLHFNDLFLTNVFEAVYGYIGGLALTNPLLEIYGGTGTNVYAKGDLLVAKAGQDLDRLAVGADDDVLIADSTTAFGVRWGVAAGGGGSAPVGTIINTTTPVTLYELFRAKDTTGTNAEPSMLAYDNTTLVLGTNAAAPANKRITGSVPTGANTAGATLTVQSPSGTGTAAGGSLLWQVSPAGASSSVTNPAVTGITLAVDAQIPAALATTITGRARFGDGTAALPSIVFTSDDDAAGTGFFRSSANLIGVAINGATTGYFSSTVTSTANILQIGSVSTTSLQREAADIIQFNIDSATPSSPLLKGPDSVGSNIAAGVMKFGPGRSTGSAIPGTVQVEVGTTGASASSQNTYATPVGVGGTLKVDTTTTGNLGAGEDDLISYTIPAGQLSKDGSFLEFDVFGTFAANANTAQLKVYFDGVAFFDTTSLLFNGVAWRGHGKIIRTGATAQKISIEFTVGGTLLSAVNSTVTAYATDGATLSGATIFKITGQDTGGVPADNKVVQEGMVLKWYPGQ